MADAGARNNIPAGSPLSNAVIQKRRVYDVIVVGAGPSGSAAAALLAERGFDVALMDRASFPRFKPCAEYLSPEASRVLDRLGLLDALEAERPARLTGMRVYSPQGTSFTGRFVGAHRFRGYRDHGLALPREVLDSHLASAAVGRGAVLMEATTAERLVKSTSGHCTLSLRRGRSRETITGRVVIGADGLNSRIARQVGLARRGRRRRIALVSHAVGVAGMTDVGEMHVSSTGYLGLASIGRGLTNVAVVVDLGRTSPRTPLDRWFPMLLHQYPAVAERLRNATFVSPVRTAGPFARWTPRATADRVVLVGDAADFYDPFTGEGIYAALRGAELAAEQVARGLQRDRLAASDLAPYDAARRRAFGGKWIVERLVSWALAHPTIFNHLANRLARRPALADLMVGVSGDFVPAWQVLRPAYVWQVMR